MSSAARWAADPGLQQLQSVPDHVMRFLAACGVLIAAWFAVKSLAARGWSPAGRLYHRLDPTIQATRLWTAAAPLTATYVAIWTITTVLQQGTPQSLNEFLTRWHSTNIVGLASQPVRVLFSSAFVVADSGFGFAGYVLVYLFITMRLEHRIGAARTLVVAGVSHVLGSLLTVAVEIWAIDNAMAPKSLSYTVDVGVSYVMVGSIGAYFWLVSRRWLPWLATALAVGVVVPMVVSHTIWDLGHFLATCLGVAAGWLVVRYPRRERIRWRATRRALSPRPLPTFPHEPRPWPSLIPATPADVSSAQRMADPD